MILANFVLPLLLCTGAQQIQSDPQGRIVPSDLVLSVYDVADIVSPQGLYLIAPRDHVLGDDEDRAAEEARERERAAARLQMRADLVADLRRWMEPAFPQIGTLDLATSDVLVANLLPKQHEWLAAFFELQRERATRVHTLSLRFLMAESIHFDGLGIEEQTRLLPAVEGEQPAVADMLAQGEVELLSAPVVSVFARQRATISIMNQTAYVRDFEYVVVAPGNQEILDPIVDVVEDGVSVDTRIVPLPGGRFGLVLDALFIDLAKPIATKEITVSPGMPPVTVGVPELRKVRLETRARLGLGETLLVSGRSRRMDGTLSSPFTIETRDGVKKEVMLTVRVDEIALGADQIEDPVAPRGDEKSEASDH